MKSLSAYVQMQSGRHHAQINSKVSLAEIADEGHLITGLTSLNLGSLKLLSPGDGGAADGEELV